MARLSEAQRRVLENLAAGRRASSGFASGRSTAGGLTGTMAALRRNGLIDRHEEITEAGRAALQGEPS